MLRGEIRSEAQRYFHSVLLIGWFMSFNTNQLILYIFTLWLYRSLDKNKIVIVDAGNYLKSKTISFKIRKITEKNTEISVKFKFRYSIWIVLHCQNWKGDFLRTVLRCSRNWCLAMESWQQKQEAVLKGRIWCTTQSIRMSWWQEQMGLAPLYSSPRRGNRH